MAKSQALAMVLLLGFAGLTRASTPPPGAGGLYFDGTNDYVTFGAAPALGVSNFTIEAWILPLGTGSNANTGSGGVTGVPLVTKGRGENDNTVSNCNFFLGIQSSDRALAADFEDAATGANHPVAGTTAVQTNVWQHAAVTYDGTRWVIYLNGQSNGTATAGGTVPRFDSIQHAALGSALNSSGTPQGYFDGVLDEVRIWNVARSAAQISNNFQLQITNATGLIGRWSLDETNGTVVTNTGSSGVNGTRINGPVSTAGYPFDNPPPANGPPTTPTLTAPADGATNLPLTTLLSATVSDPDANPLTVTFYGRALITNAPGPDFTIVTLPDTQYYAASTNGGLPAMFQAQTDWIVANRAASNIVMVTHMGDIVNNGDNGGNNVEWLVATNALYRMENPLTTLLAHGIPYGVAVGNHDQSPIGDADGTTTFFNQFFGEAHFLGFDYYGGHYGANNDNNFILFSASGLDFILINLEYDTTPSAAVLAWAEGLLNTYTNRRAILTSHYLIGTGNPAAFGAQGQITYDAFRENRNLSLMLCGHVAGEGRRADTFDQHTIHTLLADYQGRTGGGSGWLRIMTFSPSNNVIRVQTYSPWLNQFETDANSRFDVPYLMTLPAFAPIATNSVASGNATGAPWSGLATNTPYEWYAVVSDGSLYATSAVRTFRTGAAPPAGTVPQPGDVIFNEYSSDNNANGVDFFELLTLTDGLDLRGLRVTENEITNATTGELNNGEPVYTFGADSFLADVPAGTVIAIYTGTNGVVTDTILNPLASDWSLVLAPGTGVTSSADGLGGTPTGGLSTTGDALYLYLPGPDGTSAGTDNVYLDYVAWEASASLAPAGVTNLAFAAPADNGYFTGASAAQSDLAGFWTIVDAPGSQTPGLANPGQDLSGLRGTATVTLTSLDAFWKYRDTGVDLGTAWRAAVFDDSAWPSGPAQLGYGDGDEATVVGFGPNAAAKYVTTYFRRSFQVANASNFTALTLRALRDDGIAVYLNGTEVFRNNLAPGAGYATLASANVGGADESTLYTTNVNPALLVEGVNVLAVEIHQDDPGSSDISFNLELTGVQSFNGNVPPQVTLTAPANGATFITPTDIALAASASDTSGVAKVEFFAAGAKLGEDTAAPFSLVWSNVPAGTNPVFAVAIDALGASNVSETIAVRIIDPSAGALTRGPYLQLATPTSIVVRWRTDVPAGSRVTYGANPGSLTLTNEDSTLVTEHVVTLTNLAPGTRYYYAIGSALGMLAGDDANHFFLTHPVAGALDPLRVWVIGDAGRADANQTAVRDGFYNFNGTNPVHVWLQLGDNAYNNGTDGEYQAAVFNMYSNQLRNTVTWPAVGNHDTASSTVFSTNYPYFSMFTLPTNAEAGGVPSGLEHYYSFDQGPAHFVCLDSMTSSRATNGAMADWLRADLLANTNRWVIAYFHHPPYTKGSHNSDSLSDSAGAMVEMRENFLPILEAGGVDLVLTGHSHSYERSFLIDGHYNYSSNFSAVTNIVQPGSGRETNGAGAYVKPANFAGPPGGRRGAVYAVAGSSGGISGGSLNHPAMYVSLNLLGSMVLDITSNRLDAIFLREAGAASVSNDWFTLLKTDFPPVASNVAYAITHDGATNLLLRGADPNGLPLTFTGTSLPTNGLRSAITPASGAFTYTPARGATNGDAFTFTVSDGTSNSAPGTATFIVTAPLDLDGDGLGDAWEALHGVSDPNADNDGDGNSNLAEYWADTNPTNALSWLNIITITNNGVGQATITWPSVGGVRYRVQFSDGDASGHFNSAFTSIARSLTTEMDAAPAGTPSMQTFTDNFILTSGPPPNGRRYFRVQLVR